MAAIIRVKRRIDEEPLNAFVLNCKKRKRDENDGEAGSSTDDNTVPDETSTTVVKFAGTIEKQNDIASHINKLTKAEAVNATNRVRPPSNVTSKNRAEHRQQSHENRFKIVNCYRTFDAAGNASGGNGGDGPSGSGGSSSASNSVAAGHKTNVTVVDIEKQSDEEKGAAVSSTSSVADTASTSSVPATTADDLINYVYDLYVPDTSQNGEIDYNLVDNLLSVEPFEELTYGSARDNGYVNDDSDNESDDSNNENNWRNDYPDTDEDGGRIDDLSIGEDDIRNAFNNMDIDDERELSSDDVSNNGYVYSIDSEFEDDYCDSNRYGEAYARYRVRATKTAKADDDSDDDDDDDDDDDELDR